MSRNIKRQVTSVIKKIEGKFYLKNKAIKIGNQQW